MNKIYNPIPRLGTGRGSFQVGIRHRIYQASDHLLLLQNTGYTEDYRRIFYRDIRYVVIRLNQRYFWTSFVLAISIPLIGLLHFASVPWVPILIVCIPSLIGLLVNLSRGPSCDCYIATQVQLVAIPAPQRINRVPVLLEFLKTKVPSP